MNLYNSEKNQIKRQYFITVYFLFLFVCIKIPSFRYLKRGTVLMLFKEWINHFISIKQINRSRHVYFHIR
ncbi:hypothetical protein BpHYR1_046702, partial [Brachionus plicatilis]